MNTPMTMTITAIGLAFGFSVSWTGQEIVEDFVKPSATLQPAFRVNEIVLRDDGSVIYDGSVLANEVWQAWHGTILYADSDDVHCDGGDLARYEGDFRHEHWDTDYMVGGDCVEGLEAGMRYVFTWTPVGPDYAPVRYPAEGYGVVVGAKE